MSVMGNFLHDQIREIVKPMFQEIMHPTKGVVLDYSNESNYAVVEIPHPHMAGKMVLPLVPVQIMNGVHTPGPFPGDEVWVEFTGGKVSMPKVVSIADRNYNTNTRQVRLKHDQKGPFVPDILAKKV